MGKIFQKPIAQSVILGCLLLLLLCASAGRSRAETLLNSAHLIFRYGHYKDLFIIIICLFGRIISSIEGKSPFFSLVIFNILACIGNCIILFIVLIYVCSLNAFSFQLILDTRILVYLAELLLSSYFWFCLYDIIYKKTKTVSVTHLFVIFAYYTGIAMLENARGLIVFNTSLLYPRIICYIVLSIVITTILFLIISRPKREWDNFPMVKQKSKYSHHLLLLIPVAYVLICCQQISEAVKSSEYLINTLEPLCFIFGTPETIYVVNLLMVLTYKAILENNDSFKKARCLFPAYYIISSFVIILVVLLFFVQTGYLNNEWSKFIYYYNFTTLHQELELNMVFLPAYIVAFRPVSCLFTQLLLGFLYFSLCLILIDLINIFLRELTFPFLLQYIWMLMNDRSIYCQYWSPFSHAIIGNHSFGYDYAPKLSISITILLLLNAFLLILIYLTKRIRFTSKRKNK